MESVAAVEAAPPGSVSTSRRRRCAIRVAAGPIPDSGLAIEHHALITSSQCDIECLIDSYRLPPGEGCRETHATETTGFTMPKASMRRAHATVLMATLTIATVGPTIPAAAADKPFPTAAVHAATARYLAANPGGTQINDREISYQHGTFIVTVTPPTGARGVPDCPRGSFCFYEGVNYTYPRGRLSGCGWQDLDTWNWRNRIASVDFDISQGAVGFLNETGSTDTVLFSAAADRPRIPDVYPHRDKADYVSRTGC